MKKVGIRFEKDNDLYFSKAVSDQVIINNGYKGLKILDINLQDVKILDIFDDITIHHAFINHLNKEIILDCPDNNCIVYIDLTSGFFNIINNNNHKYKFRDVYCWYGDNFILSTEDGSLVKLNKTNKDISNIKKINLPFTFQESLKGYRVSYDNVIDYNRKEKKLDVINFLDRNYFSIKILDYMDIHDFVIRKNIIILVSEDEILICNENKIIHKIRPEKHYMFMRAVFIESKECDRIIITSTDIRDVHTNAMHIFELSPSFD
ncbi:hypothetical protein [Marininema halotolerans]|uniref:Uncharacterized protein n=1 Tax=Marininema halotolerans TaxID=1155944 RepID=A0A1I6PZU2_9BACL|nr:hypothetical protein [Marininema halotolerans]SFS45727.1 hypothetical protein SAMN05444972_102246 [Marininema halotolerans]